ncbi:8651_t:CDS:10 [Entrophospora sp. SA101]|nr:5397_t:CDS:10 [Entrophospora sp. SA101]CAJ0746848.1 8651_t:CDS:10 [Entrophospora sp. SA101]
MDLEISKKILYEILISIAFAGATTGGFYALIRGNQSIIRTSLSTGLNCGIFGTVFFSIRESCLSFQRNKNAIYEISNAKMRDIDELISSSMAGGVTGGLLSSIARIIPGFLTFSLMCGTGQFVYTKLYRLRQDLILKSEYDKKSPVDNSNHATNQDNQNNDNNQQLSSNVKSFDSFDLPSNNDMVIVSDNITTTESTTILTSSTTATSSLLLSTDERETKRRKIDPPIELLAGKGIRSHAQFLVELPEFSSIDWKSISFILITNHKQMLALPYITEYTDFKGKIYVAEPTVSFGRKANIFTGITKDLNTARSLYTISDIESCIDKIQPIRFNEHLMLHELQVTAYSSGHSLGSANWLLDCGYEKVAVVSTSSTVLNIHPLPFDKTILDIADVIVMCDLCQGKNGMQFEHTLHKIGESVVNTLATKGNVLFPCTLNGVIFDIIEHLGKYLRAKGFHSVPIYAVSPVAEESLKYSNISGEWMCTERQNKMYLPDNPMFLKNMIDQGLLNYAARFDSSLQKKYQEPCVVFAGHPSLRSGAAISFVRKWGTLSSFENLQIESTFIPIDIRLTVDDVTEMLLKSSKLEPQHILLPKQIITDNDKLIHIQKQLPSSMITLYDYLDVVDITINSQFLRATISESLAKEIKQIKYGDFSFASINGTFKVFNNQSSIINTQNNLNQQKYICGKVKVSDLIYQINEEILGCQISSIQEDRRNNSFEIIIDSPKAIITFKENKFNIETKDNQTRIKLVKVLTSQLKVL